MTKKERQQLRAEIAEVLNEWAAVRRRYNAATTRLIRTIRVMCSREVPE